jgi:lipoic acid synthetase/lipoate-protein ligase A
MMKLITLPDATPRRLVFYLAMEEYLSDHAKEDCLFMWQVPPTVIFGRNQVFRNEVNVPYCESHGIQMYRRKSGGGCVYSDMGNLMVSYITPDRDANQAFQRYLDRMTRVLQSMGFEAAKSSHNDIMIGDRKVSGNASFKKPTGSIVHGTMLFDTNIEEMVKAITPSTEKIQKHGVQSVRQRVVNLRELGLDSMDGLKAQIARQLCEEEVRQLTTQQIAEIEEIEKTYLDKDFITNP